MPRKKANLLKRAEQCVKNCGNNGKKVDSQNDCNQSSFEATNKEFFFIKSIQFTGKFNGI